MWWAKLDFTVDVDAMVKQLEVAKAMYSAVYDDHGYGPQFGGLSILSDNGDHLRGMVSGKQIWEDGKVNFELAIKKGINFEYNYHTKTKLCTGETERVIDLLDDLGMTPRRARYTVLKAGGKSSIHNDSKKGEYACRIHIPLITDKECTHSLFLNNGTKIDEKHFPADGSVYIMQVNNIHQIINPTKKDRWHFLCSCYDVTGYSPFKISTNELNTVKVKAEAFKNGVKWTEGGGKLFEESIHTSQAHQPDQENNT